MQTPLGSSINYQIQQIYQLISLRKQNLDNYISAAVAAKNIYTHIECLIISDMCAEEAYRATIQLLQLEPKEKHENVLILMNHIDEIRISIKRMINIAGIFLMNDDD